jgi:hypothetical protein
VEGVVNRDDGKTKREKHKCDKKWCNKRHGSNTNRTTRDTKRLQQKARGEIERTKKKYENISRNTTRKGTHKDLNKKGEGRREKTPRPKHQTKHQPKDRMEMAVWQKKTVHDQKGTKRKARDEIEMAIWQQECKIKATTR